MLKILMLKMLFFIFTREANKNSAGLGCINLVERVLAAARRAVIDSSVIVKQTVCETLGSLLFRVTVRAAQLLFVVKKCERFPPRGPSLLTDSPPPSAAFPAPLGSAEAAA